MLWLSKNENRATMSPAVYQQWQKDEQEKEDFDRKANVFAWTIFLVGSCLFLVAVGKLVLIYI